MKSDLRIDVLPTRRLLLRPYDMEDAERLTELLQDPEIHRWTSAIPFPYTLAHAQDFLEQRAIEDAAGTSFVWAICLADGGEVIGAMGLHEVQPAHSKAELGYWIGEAFRGQGYATEAARRVIAWCFEVGEFHRIQATHFPGNQGSARVMRSIGMQQEGYLRGYGFKNGEPIDVYLHAILRTDPSWVTSVDQAS